MQIFTVSELNQRIRNRLESDLHLRDIWTQGELSNVVNHGSGHRYFTLKDQYSQISCILFRNQGLNLGFELSNGLNVKIFGDISIYGPRGQLQLIARGMQLDSGMGLKHLEIEQIKQKLYLEGLFELDRKRPLPKYPTSIGIVTSLDGAALRDVLRILGSYPAKIILSPANVQGEGAVENIASAIRALRFKVDVVIVCRGGGSIEDLWAFNSEAVARAIFECNAPVIAAIGHETDITIADFVADVSAPTPTAAAKIVAPNLEGLIASLNILESRILRALWASLERKRDKLEYLNRSLSAKRMYAPIIECSQKLDYLNEQLESKERSIIANLRQDLEVLESRLTSVSPLATLSRGYALPISLHRKLILKLEEVQPGEIMELLFYSGRLKCKVLEIVAENDRRSCS